MDIKNLFKKLFVLGVIISCVVTLSGCMDLGDFENEQDYYNSFGDVILVYEDTTTIDKNVCTKQYSVRDYFYNKNTSDNFSYGDPLDDESDANKDIPKLQYIYLALPIKKDFEIDSFALFMNTNEDVYVDINLYLVDTLPNNGTFSNIKVKGDMDYNYMVDEDGEFVLDEYGNKTFDYDSPILYDDPSVENLVSSQSFYCAKDEWESFTIDNWETKEGREGSLLVCAGQYLLIKIDNNSGDNPQVENLVSFKMTNMLVRAFNIK